MRCIELIVGPRVRCVELIVGIPVRCVELIVGIPVIISFLQTGLVEKIPSAILASINMVIGFICFFSGLILDVIKKMRQEN